MFRRLPFTALHQSSGPHILCVPCFAMTLEPWWENFSRHVLFRTENPHSLFCFVFCDCPGIYSVDQPGLELRSLRASISWALRLKARTITPGWALRLLYSTLGHLHLPIYCYPLCKKVTQVKAESQVCRQKHKYLEGNLTAWLLSKITTAGSTLEHMTPQVWLLAMSTAVGVRFPFVEGGLSSAAVRRQPASPNSHTTTAQVHTFYQQCAGSHQ